MHQVWDGVVPERNSVWFLSGPRQEAANVVPGKTRQGGSLVRRASTRSLSSLAVQGSQFRQFQLGILTRSKFF